MLFDVGACLHAFHSSEVEILLTSNGSMLSLVVLVFHPIGENSKLLFSTNNVFSS
jgi:hypothetical protein